VLCLSGENYAKCDLKGQIFHRYEPSEFNGVAGGIPHLKTIVVQEKDSERCLLYMGSHNLTKAAWGAFEKSN
jgi:hypothetical protein